MKLKFYLLTLLTVVGSVSFGQTGSSKIEFRSGSKSNTEIIFELGEYSTKKVETEKGSAILISVNDASRYQLKGAPDLPKFSKSIIIPNQNDVEVVAKSKDYVELSDVLIAPSKGIITRDKNPNLIPYEYGKIYNEDAFFPNELTNQGEPYILRDFRGQVITINPFQYNAKTKVLRIYTHITLSIIEKEAQSSGKNFLYGKNKKGKCFEFNEIYKSHFLNYSSEAKYTPLSDEGRMLIISPAEYSEELDTLMQWKKQRGINVELVEYESIGSSASDIKDYVLNYYNTKGLTYLLLIGDAENIPSLSKSGDSDAAYGHLAGDDSYAEVFVGRFSAESITDVKTQVLRTIYYERDLDETNEWLSNAIGISSDEGTDGGGDDGESDIQHMDNLRTDLINYGYGTVDQIYDPGATQSNVAESVNAGRSVINYVGHGSDYSWVTSEFAKSDVDALTNENKLPYIFDVACVNGNFHGQTCFAESWMRATHNENPTGAVAIIASTINQSWSSPMDAQDEMVDILIESYENNIKRTFGGVTVNGIMHMIDEYGADGSNMANTWTIFGDPSLLLRTKNPQENTITHSDVTFVGSTEFHVDGDENSLVSLTVNDEIIATAKIVGGGADLTFDALADVGKLKVTVTGYNKTTYQSDVSIITPDSPYVIYASSTINDNTGNSNQEGDYGEHIKLNVTLKNISDLYKAYNVETKLLSIDSNIELVDTVEIYGDIEKSANILKESAYSFNLNDKITDQQNIPLQLIVNGKDENDKSYTWESKINLKANAPSLEILSFYIDDKEANDNQILDPGETANLGLVIKNSGHASLDQITGLVEYVSGSSHFSIVNSDVSAFSLEAGKQDTISFSVSVNDQEKIDTSVVVKFSLIDNKYSYYTTTSTKEVLIGEVPEYRISEEGSVTLNSEKGYFLDSGGEDAGYQSGENYTITFLPKNESLVIKANFLEFDVEENTTGCYDYLKVYDGSSTSDNLIGEYCNNNVPTEIMASNEAGALTFMFYSDTYEEREGWKAELTEVAPEPMQTVTVKFIIEDSNGFVEGAKVEFNSTEVSTDANGEALFEEVTKGTNLPYIVTKDGYESINSTITIDSDEVENLTIELLSYDVSFSVSSGEAKLASAKVEFNSEEKYTDTEGVAVFKNVYPASDLNYTITKNGYSDMQGTVNVSDDNVTLEIQLSIINSVQFINEDNMKVFPNPTNGLFNIEISGMESGTYKIKVFDVIGSIIYSNEFNGISEIKEKIDITEKAKGMYFLSVELDNEVILSKKILVR